MAPNRRAAQPVTGITAASASMYPVTTHWISAIVECSSRLSVASATLTIVVSRIDMIDPIDHDRADAPDVRADRVAGFFAALTSRSALADPYGPKH